MSSPLSITKIVLAKFLGVAFVFLCMMLLSLFFPVVTALHGGVIWSNLLCGYIGFYFWGLVCIAVGIFMSALTDNPIIAAVLGEAAMIVLIFVDNLVLNWLSTEERFVMFSQGLFRLSDLIFYISMIVLFLAWTGIAVQKRRWSRG